VHRWPCRRHLGRLGPNGITFDCGVTREVGQDPGYTSFDYDPVKDLPAAARRGGPPKRQPRMRCPPHGALALWRERQPRRLRPIPTEPHLGTENDRACHRRNRPITRSILRNLMPPPRVPSPARSSAQCPPPEPSCHGTPLSRAPACGCRWDSSCCRSAGLRYSTVISPFAAGSLTGAFSPRQQVPTRRRGRDSTSAAVPSMVKGVPFAGRCSRAAI